MCHRRTMGPVAAPPTTSVRTSLPTLLSDSSVLLFFVDLLLV